MDPFFHYGMPSHLNLTAHFQLIKSILEHKSRTSCRDGVKRDGLRDSDTEVVADGISALPIEISKS